VNLVNSAAHRGKADEIPRLTARTARILGRYWNYLQR